MVDTGISPARSVGRAASYAVHLGEEFDSRWALDTRARHFRFEFLGSNECARLFQTLPFEEKRKVVGVSSAAENTASALAVFVSPIEGGIKRRLPSRVVGYFVVDQNVDHDIGHTPFTLKTFLQTQQKCKGVRHRERDLRAAPL